MTDSARTIYRHDTRVLHIEGADGDWMRVHRAGGALIAHAPDHIYIKDAKEFIEQVARLAGLEVTVEDAAPDQSEPEAGEPDGFFPVTPNLSAVKVTEGLIARGNLPLDVLPHYDDRSGRLLGVQVCRGNGGDREEAFLGDYLVGGGGEPIRVVDRHLFNAYYRRVDA